MYALQALKWVSTLWFLILRLVSLPLPQETSALPCTLPGPRNAHFVSKNMKNILHWLPPEGIAKEELSYTVKYLIYGTNKWIKNSACKNISQTWCDLSLETYDHKDLYHASIKAFSNGNCSTWTESLRFNPLTDSQIDPPEFGLSSTEQSISVIVVPPEKWKREPIEKPEYLHQIYPDLQYNVSVFNKVIRKKWFFSIKQNRLDVLQLESNTVYCVTVQVYITPLLLSGYSKEKCISTLKDPTFKQTRTILLEYTLPALLICLFILVPSCFVYRYLHITEQAYPKNLVLKKGNKHQGDLFDPSEKTVVNFISVNIVDQCKPLQEDIHIRGNAVNPAGDCACKFPEEEPSKIHGQHSQVYNEETVLKNERDGNGVHMMRLGSHNALGERRNEDVVVYEFDVRGEDTIPEQEGQVQFCLKDSEDALEGQLHNSAKGLSSFTADETEQFNCPQYEVGSSDTLSVHKFELLSNKMAPVSLQVSLINLVTFDNGFCPKCGVATDICLAPDKKESFWECGNLTFTMTGNTATSYYPQFVTWTQGLTTVIDWDPQNGTQFLPDLSSLINKEITETENNVERLEEGMLSRLYSRQYSDDLSEGEEEAYLLQLKEQWGLKIQMQT